MKKLSTLLPQFMKKHSLKGEMKASWVLKQGKNALKQFFTDTLLESIDVFKFENETIFMSVKGEYQAVLIQELHLRKAEVLAHIQNAVDEHNPFGVKISSIRIVSVRKV